MRIRNNDHPFPSPAPAEWRREATRAAAELFAEMTANPRGTMSPSVYETARMVGCAPWLEGHGARCDFLLREQRPNGWWGEPEGYGLVPTLSAVEALLRAVDRSDTDMSQAAAPRLARAALKGLWALADDLTADRREAVPDTIAVELIVPWLVGELNDRLAGSRGRLGADVLSLPRGIGAQPLLRLREAVAAGQSVPEKTCHALEVLGGQAAGAPGVRLVASAVGSSTAATAAWLGGRPDDHPSVDLLRRSQARWGGPVPGVISIAVFERAWVIASLLDAAVPVTVPAPLAAFLGDSLGLLGAPAGQGLPADADDTAVVLHALALTGRPAPVRGLWTYEAGDHFQCFLGERTPSTSTNAHVLEALLDPPPPDEPADERVRRSTAANQVTGWLLARQQQHGPWEDKWHASPYYATLCVTAALSRGHHPASAGSLARAARWTLASQRSDGSWGRWRGTVEETAYAVTSLLHTHSGDLPPLVARAVAGGCAFLMARGDQRHFAPLWHDKDLYAPHTVIKAARAAALHAASIRLERTRRPGSP